MVVPRELDTLFAGVGAETGSITLGTPSRTPEVINRLVEAIDEQYGVGEENYRRLTARRDARTRAVLDALDSVSAPDD